MHPPDDVVFAQLYRRYDRPVRDFCRRRVASDLVDDAVAETFLTAWRRLNDVPTGGDALVWLYGVAHRVIGHQRRATARRRRLDQRLRSIVLRPASAADEWIINGAEFRLVLAAASRLGDRDAEVLRLVAWDHLSVAEVAAVLGIDPNAVKQRLHRARRNVGREYRRLQPRLSLASSARRVPAPTTPGTHVSRRGVGDNPTTLADRDGRTYRSHRQSGSRSNTDASRDVDRVDALRNDRCRGLCWNARVGRWEE